MIAFRASLFFVFSGTAAGFLGSHRSTIRGASISAGFGDFFKVPGNGRAEARGRMLLEQARSLNNQNRPDSEAQALSKVLKLFDDGLLSEADVEVFYDQLKVRLDDDPRLLPPIG